MARRTPSAPAPHSRMLAGRSRRGAGRPPLAGVGLPARTAWSARSTGITGCGSTWRSGSAWTSPAATSSRCGGGGAQGRVVHGRGAAADRRGTRRRRRRRVPATLAAYGAPLGSGVPAPGRRTRRRRDARAGSGGDRSSRRPEPGWRRAISIPTRSERSPRWPIWWRPDDRGHGVPSPGVPRRTDVPRLDARPVRRPARRPSLVRVARGRVVHLDAPGRRRMGERAPRSAGLRRRSTGGATGRSSPACGSTARPRWSRRSTRISAA